MEVIVFLSIGFEGDTGDRLLVYIGLTVIGFFDLLDDCVINCVWDLEIIEFFFRDLEIIRFSSTGFGGYSVLRYRI